MPTIVLIPIAAFAVIWVAAAAWVTAGSVAEALHLNRAADWFHRHGV